MAKKKTPNELYWEAKRKEMIKADYRVFLEEQGEKSSPEVAARFAIKSRNAFYAMKERDLIIFLAGDLPYMYD